MLLEEIAVCMGSLTAMAQTNVFCECPKHLPYFGVLLFKGGHSLGGAFALLMACMARLRFNISPESTKCFAFGAPPVLARAEAAQAESVLQVSAGASLKVCLGASKNCASWQHHWLNSDLRRQAKLLKGPLRVLSIVPISHGARC
jgi:hypothetical protein